MMTSASNIYLFLFIVNVASFIENLYDVVVLQRIDYGSFAGMGFSIAGGIAALYAYNYHKEHES